VGGNLFHIGKLTNLRFILTEASRTACVQRGSQSFVKRKPKAWRMAVTRVLLLLKEIGSSYSTKEHPFRCPETSGKFWNSLRIGPEPYSFPMTLGN